VQQAHKKLYLAANYYLLIIWRRCSNRCFFYFGYG